MDHESRANIKLREKLIATLLIYEQRGYDAIAAQVDGGDDAFIAALKRRDQVFHNLAALDRLAQHKGFDLAKDSVAREAWERIVSLNQKLSDLLTQAKLRVKTQLAAVSQAEIQARSYHSNHASPVRLRKEA